MQALPPGSGGMALPGFITSKETSRRKGSFMIARKFSQTFAICVLVWVCCVGSAESQSCLHEPVGNACYKIFGFTLGQTYIPKGSTCYCGPAAPLQETDCWVPQCTIHICLTCLLNAGKPISLANGNTFIEQQDIRVPGLGNGLTLVRTWNSLVRSSLYPGIGSFGQNWRSTYEEWIYVDDDNTVAYARGDGSVWNFVYSSGQTFSPVAPANLVAGLSQGPTTWTLTFQNGEQRVFDATSGRLLSIADRNGNTTQLTYDASFRLKTVTDPASRHLYFSYASPTSFLVTSVTSDVGISLSYSYDSQSRLIQYTKPDQTTVSFQYNDPNPHLITAVLDQNGKVLESHTYDNQARGLTSSRAGGVEAVTIKYPFGTLDLP
jgi:YD repeat-containing protein